MREVVVWLLFVLLGAVVLDMTRDQMRMSEPTPTEQVLVLA
jgi:hypothetical protein